MAPNELDKVATYDGDTPQEARAGGYPFAEERVCSLCLFLS